MVGFLDIPLKDLVAMEYIIDLPLWVFNKEH